MATRDKHISSSKLSYQAILNMSIKQFPNSLLVVQDGAVSFILFCFRQMQVQCRQNEEHHLFIIIGFPLPNTL